MRKEKLEVEVEVEVEVELKPGSGPLETVRNCILYLFLDSQKNL